MTLAATLAAAVVLPSAPLLIPGVSARPPAATDAVRAAIGHALAALPPHDLRILLAGAGVPGDAGVYTAGRADLGGLSRPELAASLGTPLPLAAALGAATGLDVRDGAVPVDLAVLALQAVRAGDCPTVAVAVPWSEGASLVALGARLREALPAGAVVIAAGDLSAGLGAQSPRPKAADGAAWNEAALLALGGGDAAAVAALGPVRAAAAAARGWPALAVLLGLLDSAPASLEVRCAAAPRGVGYVVAGT